MKRVLITGITGQDGIYLSRYLVSKGVKVIGIKRRSSSDNTHRMRQFLGEEVFDSLELVHGDMTDGTSLIHTVERYQPDGIFNLAAQSHVAVSFEEPEYTANSDALGPLRMLEAIRILGPDSIRFYQASTSEMFGNSLPGGQNEGTAFFPASPYGAAKLYAHWLTKIYRESYGLFACSGILFNHESPMRSENFVSQKVVSGFSQWRRTGRPFKLGNLNAKRDWGHAADYVVAIYKILAHMYPRDYVVSTGKSLTVRTFCELVANCYGIGTQWVGTGLEERCVCIKTNKTIIEIDPRYFRPSEVDHLEGDSSKIQMELNWEARCTVQELIDDMISYRERGVETYRGYLD
jgi:GDPmannose 4,6-dehydratase